MTDERLVSHDLQPASDIAAVRPPTVQDIVASLFPEDEALIAASAERWSDMRIVSRLRRYPQEMQEQYFFRVFVGMFTEDIPGYNNQRGEQAKLPSAEKAAKVVAEINNSPNRTGELDESMLTKVVNQFAIACRYPKSKTPLSIKIIEGDLGAAFERKQLIQNEEMDLVDEKAHYGIGRAAKDLARFARKNGFHSPLFGSIRHDVVSPIGASVVEELLPFMSSHPRRSASLSIAWLLLNRLGDAAAFAAVEHLMSTRGYAQGNPFKIYVDTASPNLIPLGPQGREFIFFKPPTKY